VNADPTLWSRILSWRNALRARLRGSSRLAWLVVFVSVVILIGLCGAIYALAEYDTQASRMLATRDLRGNVTVRVTYPTRLWFDALNERGYPLTLTVLNPPNTPNWEIVIRLVVYDSAGHDIPILYLTDKQGNPHSSEIHLTGNGRTVPSETVYLKPTLLDGAMPSTILLWIMFNGHPTSSQDALVIRVEEESENRLHFLISRFVTNASLLFAFAAGVLTLAGIWSELRKTQRETVVRERDKHIESAHALLAQDPPSAIIKLVKLAKRAGVAGIRSDTAPDRDKWNGWQNEELEQLCHRVQNSREYHEAILAELGDLSRREQLGEMGELLEAALCLFQMRLDKSKRALAPVLQEIQIALVSPAREPIADELQNARDGALELWQEYYQAAADLAGLVLLWVKKWSTPDTLDAFFHEHADVWPLLRTPLLKDSGVGHAYSNFKYEYMPIIPDANAHTAPFADWLNDIDLERNPFSEEDLRFDRVLLKGLGAPEQWNIMLSKRPMLLYSGDTNLLYARQDANAGAWRLRLEITDPDLNPQLHETVFPVWLELPLEELDDNTYTAYRKQIVKAYARAWLEFLALNPHAFFELESYQQTALDELLKWYAQSSANIIIELKKRPSPDTPARRALHEHFKQVHGHSTRLPFEALTVRPVGLDASFLIAVCADPSFAESAQTDEQMLAKLAPELSNSYVILKLFTAHAEGISFTTQRLTWSAENLAQTVGDWVRYASKQTLGERHFWDLFDANEQDNLVGSPASAPRDRADGRIALYANGSPNRMRAMGVAMIQYRINNPNDFSYPALTREIFERVVKSFNP